MYIPALKRCLLLKVFGLGLRQVGGDYFEIEKLPKISV